jgi:formate hydrogenlyase subunit 3/multisubunit Na+/H+ antiporter MnhD subunit
MIACAIAIVVLIGASVVALAANARPRLASGVAAGAALVAAILGVPSAIATLADGSVHELDLAWAPPLGHVHLGLDPLTAFFLVPLFVIGAACACYGAFYLDEQRERRALGPPASFYLLMLASMLLVLLARDAVVFLMGWEIMTITSYLLVSFDHHEPAVRRAGWIYLIAGHLGLACVLAVFVLLGDRAGGFDFTAMRAQPAGGALGVVALALAIAGFGVKAGIVPLHVWLPEAHAAAPSHVSALMSAVLIKLGIYGILRTLSFVQPTVWAGPVLGTLGAASAILGIALALYQRDIKRALAYSSIENVGVIFLGIGVGLWGQANGNPTIAALGLFGGLMHVWNHALMKGLLFLGAGSVVHAAGTRDLERLGGLLRRMPGTGSLLFVGAVAIAGLPPLAGFASEWLIYRGLLVGGVARGAGEGLFMLFGMAVLATVGVLAALCFVRLTGVALLGSPRSPSAALAHESPRGMLAPMLVLAAGAIAMPLVAPWTIAALAPVVDELAGTALEEGQVVDALVPIAIGSAGLWLALLVGFALLTRIARRAAADDTWGCGYAAPTARMQYTGSSFSDTLERLLPGRLRPHVAMKRAAEPFPAPGALSSDRDDPFTRAAYEPVLDRLARRFAQLRWVQQGRLHLYVVYIVLTVVGALAAVSLHDLWVQR